jgi:hypothetical protein
MFSKIFKIGEWFTAEIQVIKHDVDAIIADFTNTITKLEAAAQAHLQSAEHLTDLSIKYEAMADAAHSASEKATKVAGQIKALVS